MIRRIRHGYRGAVRLAEEMSLQKKLITVYIAIIFIPIALFSFIFYDSFYTRTLSAVIRSSEFVLALEEANIRSHMEQMERTAQLTISSRELLDYLYSGTEPEVDQLLEFNRGTYASLQRLLFNNPSLSNIRLFSGNAHVFEIWPTIFKEFRIQDKLWYADLANGKGRALWEIAPSEDDPLRTGSARNMVTYVSLLRELLDPEGKHAGILQVDMKLEQFFSKTLGPIRDEESQVFVIDRRRQVHTGSSGSDGLGIGAGVVLQLLDSQEAQGGQSFEFEHSGVPYLGIYKHIDGLDAYLVHISSLQKPLSEIRETRNYLLLIAFSLLLILSAATYFMQSIILKKLHMLKASMQRVRHGDFNIDIRVDSKGEIGELAHHFRKMVSTINELIAAAVNKQAAAKEAELHSLKNQINSHFMYNTLENLKMMAEIEGQYTLSDALTSLGGMMRYSMKWNGDQVRLGEELAHIRNYAAIMNVRFEDAIVLDIDIPPEELQAEVPKMFLQPIIENSIQHGMKMPSEVLRIRIAVQGMPECLLITITDDGAGMSAGEAEELNHRLGMDDAEYRRAYAPAADSEERSGGIGLRNVNQRIRMYYGGEFGISVHSRQGNGTQVALKLPHYLRFGGTLPSETADHRG